MIPIPILLLAHFLFGFAVAFASRRSTRLSSRSAFSSRGYAALLASEALLGIPIGIYLYVFHRDWSLMYLVDGARVPSAIAVALLAAFPGAATIAFFVGVALLRARRDALLGGFLAVIAVGALVLGLVLRDRLMLVGPFGGYHGGYGMRSLLRTALGPVAGLLTVTLLVGWAHVLWRTSREEKAP